MFFKLAKHRKFDYTPLYYDPQKEEAAGGRPRIQFRRLRHRTKTRPFIWLLALLFIVIYLLIALSKLAHTF
jgi:hypothetical protein